MIRLRSPLPAFGHLPPFRGQVKTQGRWHSSLAPGTGERDKRVRGPNKLNNYQIIMIIAGIHYSEEPFFYKYVYLRYLIVIHDDILYCISFQDRCGNKFGMTRVIWKTPGECVKPFSSYRTVI